MNPEAIPIATASTSKCESQNADRTSSDCANKPNPKKPSPRLRGKRNSKVEYVFPDPKSDEGEKPERVFRKKKIPRKSANRSRWPRVKKCEACAEELPYRTAKARREFKEHKRGHVNGGLFICPHENCLKKFVRQRSLMEHFHMFHFTVRELICQKCKVRYRNGACLKRHSLWCRENEEQLGQ